MLLLTSDRCSFVHRESEHLRFEARHPSSSDILGLPCSPLPLAVLFESFTDFSNPCIGGLAFAPAAPSIAMASLLVILCVLLTFVAYRLAARPCKSRSPPAEIFS